MHFVLRSQEKLTARSLNVIGRVERYWCTWSVALQHPAGLGGPREADRLRAQQGVAVCREEDLLLLRHRRVHGPRGRQPQRSRHRRRLVVVRRTNGEREAPSHAVRHLVRPRMSTGPSTTCSNLVVLLYSWSFMPWRTINAVRKKLVMWGGIFVVVEPA